MPDAHESNPADELKTFLWFAGWKSPELKPLAGDASTRKYFRIVERSRSAILMDASLNRDSLAAFVQIDEHLRRLEFHAPKILARDIARGWLLLEDFGDDTFAALLDKGADAAELYVLGIDVLAALHAKPDAAPENLRRYDPEKMLEDIELFLEWRTPRISAEGANEFRRAWREVLPLAHAVPSSLLLRDYHAANLMLLKDETGLKRVGLLDFQDAYVGPVTYDLISLLEDARRDLPDGKREKMLDRYCSKFPNLNLETFRTSLAIVAAQRHTRVLAIFERLSRAQGKHDYKRLHSPRVERLLETALEQPVLAEVKRWMNQYAMQS
jgi:Predicted phosphotransferase related to Ser/Thr protein kinases